MLMTSASNLNHCYRAALGGGEVGQNVSHYLCELIEMAAGIICRDEPSTPDEPDPDILLLVTTQRSAMPEH